MTPESGISHALALERAARLRDLAYAIRMHVPSDSTQPLRASVVASFTLIDAAAPLVLDFAPSGAGRLYSITCNGQTLAPDLVNGHVTIPAEALREGPTSIRLTFDAGDAPLNRRDEYLYSIFVPARAHEALPCFDQPDLKARWSLTLDIPEAWQAVSNGAELARERRAGASDEPRSIVSFAPTEPVSTYLFAFAAGRFDLESRAWAGTGGTIRVFHRETDRALLARNVEAIVDLHAEAIAWLEDYTGIPYPFGKFDIVILPDFQFGGMEHPGAIFYNATGLLLEESATRQQQLARAHVIAHETAHMWFGDLVTMRWFGDVWMKEVFANFMAAKITKPSFPDLDHDLRFLHAHYPGAYDVDRTPGSHPIRQTLDNLRDAGSLYGAIVYLKSPVVMRQLELILGTETLRDGVREYLRRYRFGSASWPDLIDILAGRTDTDLRAWSHDWIEESGRPVVRVDLTCGDGGIERVTLTTADTTPGRQLHWPQRLDVALGYGSRTEHVTCQLNGRTELPEAVGRPAPDYVLPNGRGLGYGEFHVDDTSLAWLMRHLPTVADALTRASAWLTLWDAMLGARVQPTALVDLMLASLPRETSDLNVQRILAWLERMFWVFLPTHERARMAAPLEAALRDGLATATTQAGKGAYFATLRALSTTPEAVAWLHDVWSGVAEVPGLPLSETDRILLVEELAVRGQHSSAALVQQQLEHTLNDERRAGLAFVAPALSSDEAARDRFFERLGRPDFRRREPWVLDGLRWLHHPLGQPSSLRYVAPGLEMLEAVAHTGDIFLPKRWVDATLGAYGSPDAAAIVHRFLESRPEGYPSALRRIVLSSADYLFRASGAQANPLDL